MSLAHIPQEIWDSSLTSKPQAPVPWLWRGFVAGGHTTLLTSQWKSGKTTLVSLLLARRREGGSVAGLAVKPGKTIVVTEEGQDLWSERVRRLNFGGQVCFIFRPFASVPRPDEWQALLNRIMDLRARHGTDLLVLDPLAPLLRSESSSKCIFEALLPLRPLTERGMGVLVPHHPGKGERLAGQAARGHGSLLAHVDISMEMHHPGGDPNTRRRRLLTLSRFTETPRHLVMELNADGNDYVAVTAGEDDEFFRHWPVLRGILEDADKKMTRRDILADWPDDHPKPVHQTLWRWLTRAVERGLLCIEGSGRKRDPFRYYLDYVEEDRRRRDPEGEAIQMGVQNPAVAI